MIYVIVAFRVYWYRRLGAIWSCFHDEGQLREVKSIASDQLNFLAAGDFYHHGFTTQYADYANTIYEDPSPASVESRIFPQV